ncbi:hypothetical protein MFIFM68171_01444 [Madurella fahalii]|uniref:Uncharacterized protein n=1 Tax=Madurella fahalii TaxID=1157608 RepID=A0ABQ0G0P1_9PEZI
MSDTANFDAVRSLQMLPPGWLEAGSGDNTARSTKSESREESSEIGSSDQASGSGNRSQAARNEAEEELQAAR